MCVCVGVRGPVDSGRWRASSGVRNSPSLLGSRTLVSFFSKALPEILLPRFDHPLLHEGDQWDGKQGHSILKNDSCKPAITECKSCCLELTLRGHKIDPLS